MYAILIIVIIIEKFHSNATLIFYAKGKPMSNNNSGTLIAVEGIDGAGKSTLVHALGTLLKQQAYTVLITKEPGGTPLGMELRHLLQYQKTPLNKRAEYLLFAADRAQHFADVVIPALKQGSIVLSDRMSDSSIAYQGYGRGHDLAIINALNTWTMFGHIPDLTIYLRIDVEHAYARLNKRKDKPTVFEQETRAFMERVMHGFESIYASRSNVLILDARQSPEQLTSQAHAYIMQHIDQNHA